MPPGSPITHFAGFDWAKQTHHAVIVNAAGQIVSQFSFAHSQEGWQHWREQAARFAPLAVAIETSQGAVAVTASIGVAVADADHPGATALLAAADRALYNAKHAGRDRVCMPD